MQDRVAKSPDDELFLPDFCDMGTVFTVVVVGTLLEERKLVSEFGRQYTDYQQRVSMLLPVKWARQALLRRR